MGTTSPSRPTMTEEERVFPFFDLPREMRDMIYDLVRAEIKPIPIPETSDDPEGEYLRIHVKDGPRTNLLLVSKQFSSEYLDIVRREDTTMILEDRHSVTGDCSYHDPWTPTKTMMPVVPNRLMTLSKVEFVLQARGYTTHDDLVHARTLLKSVLPAMTGKIVTVKLFLEDNIGTDGYYYWPDSDFWDFDSVRIQKIAEVEGIARFEFWWNNVWNHDSQASRGVWEDRDVKCLEIWTKETGWKVTNPDADGREAAEARARERRKKLWAEMSATAPPAPPPKKRKKGAQDAPA